MLIQSIVFSCLSAMTSVVDNYGDRRGSAVTLTLFNLPHSATEDYIHSLFPTAQQIDIIRRQNEPTSSQGMCILRFNSSYDCQKVYAECQGGKEVAGRMLHAELGENYGYSSSQNTEPHGNTGYGHSDRAPSSDSVGQNQPRYSGENSRSDPRAAVNGGCNLTLSNLPYSATENDIWNEFPEAFKVVLNLDERGRSRGVAHVSFSNKEQCSAALESCNHKIMSGRPIRGRLTRDNDDGNNRDFGDRQGRFNNESRDFGRPNRYNDDQRDFGGRSGKFGDGYRDFSGRRGRFGDEQRDFGSRPGSQGSYNNDRRDNSRYNNNSFGGRGGSGGGPMRGSTNYPRGGNRGGPGGGVGNRFGGRDDRSDSGFANRRDRSPGRDEPIRGYGNSKGPRITSAVINRPGGVSSESSTSSDED